LARLRTPASFVSRATAFGNSWSGLSNWAWTATPLCEGGDLPDRTDVRLRHDVQELRQLGGLEGQPADLLLERGGVHEHRRVVFVGEDLEHRDRGAAEGTKRMAAIVLQGRPLCFSRNSLCCTMSRHSGMVFRGDFVALA
jgi:hypothetical protein